MDAQQLKERGRLDPDDAEDVAKLRAAITWQREQADNSKSSPSKKILHFAIGLALFAWAFGGLESVDAFVTRVLPLIGVLFVHELGHLAAMRAFGYADLKVFFIPFFGAAASGRKRDATPTQQAVVLLMGPLPGLIAAGIALMFAPFDSETTSYIVVLTLVINALNLLPVVPLDGGRFMNLTLFSRAPMLRVVVVFASGLALLAYAWFQASWIMGGLGVFVLMSTQFANANRNGARMMAQIQQQPALPSDPLPDELVGPAIEIANRTWWSSASVNPALVAYVRAVNGIWQETNRQSVGAGALAALLCVYAVSLGGSIYAWLWIKGL